MKKLKALCRENKAPLLLLVAADLGTLLLYFWAQHFENAGAYFLAFGTPARLIADLLLMNASVLALVAAGRYRRAKCTGTASQVSIDTRDDLSLRVTGFISDTMPKYVQPGMPDYIPNLIGANYERGNLEQLSVVFENRLGSAIETDDSYTLERKISRKWYAVEECEGYVPHWSKLVIPVGTSEAFLFPAWGRYCTLARGYYRVVKTLTVHGETVHLAGEFLLP